MFVTRSGYTGEDGFEIAVPAAHAAAIWQLLAADPRVQPIGLGARDSLRLEAGLCLYGHDIDTTTSPIEAGLHGRSRSAARAEGGFPGCRAHPARVEGWPRSPPRRHQARRPRAGTRGHGDPVDGGDRIGTITSGGFGPTVNGPIAMGYVAQRSAAAGTKVQLVVRGKPLPAEVVAMPFVRTAIRYVRRRPDISRGREPMDKFTKDHEWIRVDGDVATIGITKHAAEQLGDVVFVEVPEVGRKVKAGEACAVVESVKAASDVYAPVSGEVIAANADLAASPATVNEDAGRQGLVLQAAPRRTRASWRR